MLTAVQVQYKILDLKNTKALRHLPALQIIFIWLKYHQFWLQPDQKQNKYKYCICRIVLYIHVLIFTN